MEHINLSKTLSTKRQEKGITQEELAEYIGVTKASVSKWETGQSYPDIVLLPQLATYFNISIDELVNYNPQMTKHDIKKLYIKLAKDFSEKSFAEVFVSIEEIVKKYFSCFPLLHQMGVLLLNHFSLAEEEKQKEILNFAIGLFVRIKLESNDLSLCKQSNHLQAICHIALNDPVGVIDLLDDIDALLIDDESILANAYVMHGNVNKASEILQISTYQHILVVLNNLIATLSMVNTEDEKLEITVNRITDLIETFNITSIHPATVLNTYITIAVNYAMKADDKKVLWALKKYSDLAVLISYPIRLCGDTFFDKIDNWIATLDMQGNPLKADSSVKESIADAVIFNPMFTTIADTSEYKSIIQKLQTLKEN